MSAPRRSRPTPTPLSPDMARPSFWHFFFSSSFLVRYFVEAAVFHLL